MKLSDAREILVWASAALILIAGVFWASAAFTQEKQPAHPNMLDGCTLTAEAASTDKPYSVEITVKAENTVSQPKNLDFDIEIVRRELTGSPFIRVLRPSDFKVEIERKEHVKMSVGAKGTAKKVIVVPIAARQSENEEGGLYDVTYSIQVAGGASPIVLTSFGFDIVSSKKK